MCGPGMPGFRDPGVRAVRGSYGQLDGFRTVRPMSMAVGLPVVDWSQLWRSTMALPFAGRTGELCT